MSKHPTPSACEADSSLAGPWPCKNAATRHMNRALNDGRRDKHLCDARDRPLSRCGADCQILVGAL